MGGGWIKFYRQAIHSPELSNDISALGFWCWLLMQAAHKPVRVYRGKGGRRVDLQPGQLVVAASAVPGLTRKRAEAMIQRFRDAGMITVETRRDTGHTIGIVKWLDYQGNMAIAENTKDIERTSNGQTTDIQGATAQEEQEIQEGKERERRASAPAPKALGSFLPADWQPSETDREYARSKWRMLDPAIDAEAAKFRDW